MTLFPNLCRQPDSLFFVSGDGTIIKAARRGSSSIWSGARSAATVCEQEEMVTLHIESASALCRVFLRWRHDFLKETRFLGDTWERSYGNLEWRTASPQHVMPWYFLASRKGETAGYGVGTGAACIAIWRIDRDGVTLELDVRSGGVGVELGDRGLDACTIRQTFSQQEETPYNTARRLCSLLCPSPLLPSEPIIGHNDWYWLYGHNSAGQIVEATRRLTDLVPGNARIRPWSIVDDGWQSPVQGIPGGCNGGPWDQGNDLFPDMGQLSEDISALGARPGIWMRPLLTAARPPASWLLRSPRPTDAAHGYVLDPSHPEVLHHVETDMRRVRGWGYELIKHDFTTFDITGRWGFEMNTGAGGFTSDGWSFHTRSKTTAEIITELYRRIRKGAGSHSLIMGCNAVGHLGAGLMELQRIGDDTSATDWARTRGMGVNTLAFRLPQHGRLFSADADCIPVSPHIPEKLTLSWLDLVARSGTPLLISLDPAAQTPGMTAALKRAFACAIAPAVDVEPLDWMETSIPREWRFGKQIDVYRWSEFDAPPSSPASSSLCEEPVGAPC